MNFTATDQQEEVTRERIEEGECWIVETRGQLLGTAVLVLESKDESDPRFYREKGVAHFGQFATDPSYQRLGVGSFLLGHLEQRARELGAVFLALDTAEPAFHLVSYYSKRGYEQVDRHQWPGKSYPSLIMAKGLRSHGTQHQ